MPSKDADAILEKQIIARQDSILYTYRTHEQAADRFRRYETWRKLISMVLIVLATSSFLTVLANVLWVSQEIGSLLVAVVAMLSASVSLAADYLRFDEKTGDHARIAVKLRQVYVGYESLIVDVRAGTVDLCEAFQRRDELNERECELLDIAPRTTEKDFKRADKSIIGSAKPYSPKCELAKRQLFESQDQEE